MKIIEKAYFTLLVLCFASIFISPIFFEDNRTLKYDSMMDVPALQAMGWSAAAAFVLGILGILYHIWYGETKKR